MALTWPTSIIAPEGASHWLEVEEQVNPSRFTGVAEVSFRFSKWRLMLFWPALDQRQLAPIVAFFSRSQGSVTALEGPFYDYRVFRGSSPGTGLTLSGAHSGDTNVVTTTGVGGLANDDYLQLGVNKPRIHRVVSNSGNVYTVEPRLRKDYAGGTAVRTLADGWPLVCSVICPVMPQPRSTAVQHGSQGHVYQPFSVECEETLIRGHI